MTSPKISVIVPVYNPGSYLAACVDSILNQTERDMELILVDDGSTDGSERLCDEYAQKDARVRVIHQPNGGVSRARNAGLDAARGEWIAFADGDDRPEPNMYETLLKEQARTGCCGVFCGFRRVYRDHTAEETFPARRVLKGEDIRGYAGDLMNAKVFGAIWRGLYSRRALGDCRFDGEVRYAEDLLFNLEFLKAADSIALIPDVLYNYNQANEDSVCARTVRDPDFRYTLSLQRQLQLNEYWRIPLDMQEFYRVYVDMMFQFLVRKLEEGGSEALVERYLTEGFFAGCCHYDKKIPLRRRIVCILIRNRRFRLAVAVRKAEDRVLRLLGR